MICFVSINTAEAQIFNFKKKKETPTEKPKKKSSIKEYSEVITSGAVSDTGLISTHVVEDNYYFEIGDSLLEREILVVSRISGFVKGLNLVVQGLSQDHSKSSDFKRRETNLLHGRFLLIALRAKSCRYTSR